jgi:acylphosphatase
MKRVRVLVSGKVQGVFFRGECADTANHHGVTGFVRNLPDGRVEAAFEGPDEAVDAMVTWCHQGSSWARVDSVEVEAQSQAGDAEFRVR